MSAKELIQWSLMQPPTERDRQLREVYEDIGSMGLNQLTPQDVDALAEQYVESRVFPQAHTNFHDL